MIAIGSRRVEVPHPASKHDCGGFNNLIDLTMSTRYRGRDNSKLFVNVVFSKFPTLIAA